MGVATGRHPRTVTLRARLPAEGTAGTPGEYTIGRSPDVPSAVVAVRYIPDAAITGVATNNKSVNVRNRGTDGLGALLPATITFANAVNGVAFAASALTLHATAANRDLAANSVVTVQTLVNGSGMVLPAGAIEIEITTD